MGCREKWIIRWTNPKTSRWGQKTFRNEDKALAYIMKMIRRGYEVESDFRPCGDKNQ
jgi:hypothetical protein